MMGAPVTVQYCTFRDLFGGNRMAARADQLLEDGDWRGAVTCSASSIATPASAADA